MTNAERKRFKDAYYGECDDSKLVDLLDAMESTMTPVNYKALVALRAKAEAYDDLWDEYETMESAVNDVGATHGA